MLPVCPQAVSVTIMRSAIAPPIHGFIFCFSLQALAEDFINFIPAQLAWVALDDVAGIRHLAQHLGSDLHFGFQLPHFGGQAALPNKGAQGL